MPLPSLSLRRRLASASFLFLALCSLLTSSVGAQVTTGSIEGGLYGLAATSLVAAVVIFFARTAPGAKGKNLAKPHEVTAVVATASPAASH